MDPLSRRRFLKLGTRVGGAAALGPWAASLSGALPPPDLLISGGTVIDPMNGVQGIRDVLIRGDVIQSVGRFTVADIRDARGEPLVIDAKGKWVVPGLVDLHAHVDGPGAKLGLQVDDLMSETGVTTCVSAGDVGAPDGGKYRREVLEPLDTRVFAMLHISDLGLQGFPAPEMLDLNDINVESAARTVAENRDLILGIKVRETQGIVGENGLEPLRLAIKAAEMAGDGTRVMCHISDAPGELSDLLDLLRPGDILTHCFSGKPNNIAPGGKILPAAFAAQARGVIFDVGHGAGSFDFNVAEAARDQGLRPDTLSSDLHSASIVSPGKPRLPWVMSKFMQMGYSLEEVVAMATVRPATVINRVPNLGTLSLGAPADVTVLEMVNKPSVFIDTMENERTGDRHLRPVAVVRAGRWMA